MGSTSGKNDSTARGADIGMIGLAVMGSNLALNMNGKGFDVAVYNHRPERTRDFMSGPAKGKAGITAFYTLEEFVGALKKPRKVFLMIRAGSPVDEMMGALIPLLEPGDIIIDGGNSYFGDTAGRAAEAESHGLRYIGTGVSGGEEGATIMVYEKKRREQTNLVRDTYMRHVKWTKEGLLEWSRSEDQP